MTVQADRYPHLLSYNGFVVPWVTRWTNERPSEPVQITDAGEGKIKLTYRDGLENRESNGILWTREGLTRGGKPEYSQVSAYRQRACMNRCRCQVCGRDIPDKVIPWLFAPGQLEEHDGRVFTMNPPTCADCAEVAKALCPHLGSKGWQQWDVLEFRIWGVSGDVVAWEDGSLKRLRSQRVGYDYTYAFPFTAVLAKQQIVELTKLRPHV